MKLLASKRMNYDKPLFNMNTIFFSFIFPSLIFFLPLFSFEVTNILDDITNNDASVYKMTSPITINPWQFCGGDDLQCKDICIVKKDGDESAAGVL